MQSIDTPLRISTLRDVTYLFDISSDVRAKHVFCDANVFADYAFAFPIYRDIRYALKEITHLSGVRRYFRSKQRMFRDANIRELRSNGRKYILDIQRATCVYACTGAVARIAGQECFQIWKFDAFLRRETRPHTEGRRQTERRFLRRLRRVPLFSSRNLYAPA